MSAAGEKPLGVRNAFAKAFCKIVDPASLAKEEVKAPAQPRRRKSAVKKPNTPKKKVAYLPTPPESSESEEEEEKKPKPRNLCKLLDDLLKSKPKRGRKKKAELSDDDSDEEKEQRPVRRDPKPWYEGVATPADLLLSKINYKPGGYFAGRLKVLQLVELDERRGATYMAKSRKHELVLRVNFIQKDEMELLNTEAKFLEMMELNGVQHFFSTLYDLGVVGKERVDGKAFYATIYRGGPTLQQCHTLRRGEFKPETVDRLGAQIVKIFEQICGQGYRILSFSPDDFTVDRRSREIFLNNYTNIVKAADPAEIADEEVKKMIEREKKRRRGWQGIEDFAPLKWHEQGENHVMSELDTMESLVYMLIHLHTGRLPWTRSRENKARLKVFHSKKGTKGALLERLPPALRCLWYIIRNASCVKFPYIHTMLTKWTTNDEDYRYDWETVEYPTDDQERLIHLHDKIKDTQKRIAAMEIIFENERLLAKR